MQAVPAAATAPNASRLAREQRRVARRSSARYASAAVGTGSVDGGAHLAIGEQQAADALLVRGRGRQRVVRGELGIGAAEPALPRVDEIRHRRRERGDGRPPALAELAPAGATDPNMPTAANASLTRPTNVSTARASSARCATGSASERAEIVREVGEVGAAAARGR